LSIFEDLSKRIKGWPALFIGPVITTLLGLIFFRYSDWIILALIGGLWLAMVYVFWYIRHIEKRLEGGAKGASVPRPSEEILFVLGTLVGVECEYLNRGLLVNSYDANFKGRNADEFAAVIRVLRGAGLIRYYADEDDKVVITDSGSAYYLTHKKRAKKIE
jgi:hypothetical protein